jgi:hypothetical protein
MRYNSRPRPWPLPSNIPLSIKHNEATPRPIFWLHVLQWRPAQDSEPRPIPGSSSWPRHIVSYGLRWLSCSEIYAIFIIGTVQFHDSSVMWRFQNNPATARSISQRNGPARSSQHISVTSGSSISHTNSHYHETLIGEMPIIRQPLTCFCLSYRFLILSWASLAILTCTRRRYV